MTTPITLEAVGAKSWSELYAMDTVDVVRLIDEKNVPLHPGDAFLAITVLRGVAELRQATDALDRGTTRLVHLTYALTFLAIASLVIAVIALISG